MHGSSERPPAQPIFTMPRRAAPPKQTSLRAQSEPDSDSDAPEAVSLASAQKAARQQAGAVEAFKAAERAKVKAKRRERDERGKERARDRRVVEEGEGERGFAGEGEDEEARRLQERMARAMEEAGGESGSEDEEVAGSDEELLDDLDDEGEVQADEEDEDGEEASDAELEGDGEGTDDEFSEGDDDDDDADSEASSDAPPIGLAPSRTKPSSTPRHLPDALFASAFASQSAAAATTSNASRPAKRRAPAVLRKNVKRARKGTQDVVVGCVLVVDRFWSLALTWTIYTVLEPFERSPRQSSITLLPRSEQCLPPKLKNLPSVIWG